MYNRPIPIHIYQILLNNQLQIRVNCCFKVVPATPWRSLLPKYAYKQSLQSSQVCVSL